MSLVKRHKNSIFGLNGDLQALQAADATETAARIAGDASVQTNLDTETAARIAGDAAVQSALTAADAAQSTALAAEVAARTAADTAENTRALAAEAALSAALTTETTRATGVEATLQTAIDNILANNDPAALDSLTEVVAAFQSADSTLNGAITTLAGAAGANLTAETAAREAADAAEATARTAGDAALQASITAEETRALAAEAVLAAADATETAARIAADAALDTSLKAYADAAAIAGGSIPVLESVIVASDKVVLAHAPKAGINGIVNYATARYTDTNGVAYDAPLTLDSGDATGKTFNVHVDISGEWDTKSVMVQYSYVAGA